MTRTALFDAIRPFAPERRFLASHVQTIDALADSFGLARLETKGLSPSPRIKAFIKNYEKCRLRAFLPTPNDVPTIGWGRTKGVKLGMTQTQAEADADFDADIAERAAFINDKLDGCATTQDQFDAMLSLAYNIGLDAFAGSTVLRKHKAGDYAGAADAFGMWVKQAGKTLAGLVTRRAAEARIYRGLA